MSRSCWLTSPPEPNHARPLCENDGHALVKMDAASATISARIPTATPPRIHSAGSRRPRTHALLTERDPLRVDDRARGRARRGPLDVGLGGARGRTARDHPEIAHARVLAALGV